MNLDSFERQVPSETLKRGQKYYEDDHVSDLEEVTPGEWEAGVEGSDTDYVVGISLNGRTITDSVCTCPYAEQRNVCKHIVAVILEIRSKLPPQTVAPKDKQEILANLKDIIGETAPAVSNKPLTDMLELYEAWKAAPEVVKNTVAIAAFAYSGITPTSILEVYSDSMWPLPRAGAIQETIKLATATGWVTKKGADVVIKKPFGVYLCLLHRTDREFQPVIRKLTESAPKYY